MELTDDEEEFLIKKEKKKEKQREAQKKYYKKKIELYKQNDEKNEKIELYNNATNKQEYISIDDIKDLIKDVEIIEKERLKKNKSQNTISNYINLLNQINKLILKKPLTDIEKDELINIIHGSSTNYIILSYLHNDNIEKTIEQLRNYYNNDNTFRNILNILNIITNYKYNLINKLFIYYTKQIINNREKNIIDINDKEKIITLDRKTIIKNIEKIENINEKLLYSLYTLIPARRLEWRKIIITYNDLNMNEKDNYIIIDDEIKCIFNDYKTFKIYKKQILLIKDDYLIKLINDYIKHNNLKEGYLLFSQEIHKKKEMAESNFSQKLKDLFYSIYKTPICLRFIRISHIVYFIKLNPNPTLTLRKEFSTQMGHSVEEQLRYNKIM